MNARGHITDDKSACVPCGKQTDGQYLVPAGKREVVVCESIFSKKERGVFLQTILVIPNGHHFLSSIF